MDRHSFPGRRGTLESLLRMRENDQLGQPFLLAGPDGSGKENTALEFARIINCSAPETCGAGSLCESCAKALAFQHPDIHWIGPAPATVKEDDIRALLVRKMGNPFDSSPWAASSQVGIGDPENPGPMTVRSLIHFLRRKAFQSPYKVAIVADAHRMNLASANAFLKTLEEPPPRSVIFLLSSASESMLPTIRSRCRKIQLDPWPVSELAPLLAEQAGVTAEAAAGVIRAADGNARRALALLTPGAGILVEWAMMIFEWIQRGDRALCAVAADELHRGAISHAARLDENNAGSPESKPAKEPIERRARAIRLCELLALLYSDTVACRELGTDWIPRLEVARESVQRAAASRGTRSLLQDLARIESARGEIDRNLNIGLVMAVLFEELSNHVGIDQGSVKFRASAR